MSVVKMGEFWWKGPGWLRDSDNWPSDIKTKATAQTEKEVRIIKDLMTRTTLKSDVMDEIQQRYKDAAIGSSWESHHGYRDSGTTAKGWNWKDNQGLWQPKK